MSNPISLNQINAFSTGDSTFLSGLKPSDALYMPPQQLLYILGKKLGQQYFEALDPNFTVPSPLSIAQVSNSQWLRYTKMVGINVRTVFSFWHVVKYALTLPSAQNAVHLLPIWEPGVVASLYGKASWHVNPEFFSEEMRVALPHLDTVEKQLKVVVNILHALGKVVGMDVIPHTDRFSEQVIANPSHFEWLQRVDFQIVNHENNLHEKVETTILDYLRLHDIITPEMTNRYFFHHLPETERCKILFGDAKDYDGRLQRRNALIQWLYENHLETVPATMGPPYRGIAPDTEGGIIIDKKGRQWVDFKITRPEIFSRVFGPLTRYKLFENKDNNADWAIDFDQPRRETWHYVAAHYDAIQAEFNFDFMRGDMAHVQMRPEGVPANPDANYYDILAFIKKSIQRRVPYFANFAETFLAPDGEMAYGDEVAHLEAAAADATLGDLQSMVVGSERFLGEFKRYLDILHRRVVAPCFTVMTADKDDPRFDAFYLKGNEARFFIALFLPEMPSYVALGFEQRDPHPLPAPNEHYTKLYVFQIDEGEKATHGNYIWGKNDPLFLRLNAMKNIADKIHPVLQYADCQWLIKPNIAAEHKVIAWKSGNWFFIVNLDIDNECRHFTLPPPQYPAPKFLFSTHFLPENEGISDAGIWSINSIAPGEGRIYELA